MILSSPITFFFPFCTLKQCKMDQKLQVPAAIWTVSRKGDGDKERQDRLFSWSRATRTPLKLLGAWETTVLKNRSKGPRARLPGESWKGFFCLFVCILILLHFAGVELLYTHVHIHIHISPLFWSSFPLSSAESTEWSSLGHTAGSHEWSILFTAVLICPF